MNVIKKLIVSGLVLSMASFASAETISGSTDFRVTLPEVLVLYHWDDAHLTLTDDVTMTAANDSDGREISDKGAHDLTAPLTDGSYTVTGNVNTTEPAGAKFNDRVSVTLKNSWAVRSLSSGNVTLALTNDNDTLKNVGNLASFIKTENAKLTSAGTDVTNSGTASISIPSGWTPVLGDITFDLNLANANSSGQYNTRGEAGKAAIEQEATDTFLLTLTGATATAAP